MRRKARPDDIRPLQIPDRLQVLNERFIKGVELDLEGLAYIDTHGHVDDKEIELISVHGGGVSPATSITAYLLYVEGVMEACERHIALGANVMIRPYPFHIWFCERNTLQNTHSRGANIPPSS